MCVRDRVCVRLLPLVSRVRVWMWSCPCVQLAGASAARNLSMVDLHRLHKLAGRPGDRSLHLPRMPEYSSVPIRVAPPLPTVRLGFDEYMNRSDDDEPPSMD